MFEAPFFNIFSYRMGVLRKFVERRDEKLIWYICEIFLYSLVYMLSYEFITYAVWLLCIMECLLYYKLDTVMCKEKTIK